MIEEANASSGSSGANAIASGELDTVRYPDNETNENNRSVEQSASNALPDDVSVEGKETGVVSPYDSVNSLVGEKNNIYSKSMTDYEPDSFADESLIISDVFEENNSEVDQNERMEESLVGATIRRDIADGLYVIVPKLNASRCVSIAGNSKSNGASVKLVAKNCGFA